MSATLSTVAVDTGIVISVGLPDRVVAKVATLLTTYEEIVDRILPVAAWHLPLVMLETETKPMLLRGMLTAPFSRAYVPTITLTHLGVVDTGDALALHVAKTPLLEQLQSDLEQQVRAAGLRPVESSVRRSQIVVAELVTSDDAQRSVRAPDKPVLTSFSIHELDVLRKLPDQDGVRRLVAEGTIAISE